jgi:hypothetical protein
MLNAECRKPCNVVFRYMETGEKVRVSTRSGQVLHISPEAEATVDYKKKSLYKGNKSNF